MIRVVSPKLFNDGYLSHFLDGRKCSLRAKIADLNKEAVFNDAPKLLNDLIEEYKLVPPQVYIDKIYRDGEPIEVKMKSVGPNPNYMWDSVTLVGKSIKVVAPFSGNSNMLRFSPNSMCTTSGCKASVSKNEDEIVIEFHTTSNDGPKVSEQCYAEFETLRNNLQQLESQILVYNNELPGIAEAEFKKRKDQVQNMNDFNASITLPIRKRNNPPHVATVPAVRPKPVRISQSSRQLEKNPEVDDATYENILRIIFNMSRVLECNPSSFVDMKEEALRTHFLVQLNGQYEGNAGAEAFNFKGKTDILVRVDGKIVFIAECKFWSGEKTFLETIDQILRYLSWRETKAAILLFNRNKKTSAVLNQIPNLTKSHPNYVKEVSFGNSDGTQFRYIFSQPSDPEKKLLLSVCVFDVPCTSA